MLGMFRDLLQHKWYADSRLLSAICSNPAAANDPELCTLLHHTIVANRFWLALSLDRPFDHEREALVPGVLEDVLKSYEETYRQERAWIEVLNDAVLARRLETPFLPGNTFSVAEALMQVCLHSHGHRAQCAKRLRVLGSVPPTLDFILWLTERPSPDWRFDAAHQTN